MFLKIFQANKKLGTFTISPRNYRACQQFSNHQTNNIQEGKTLISSIYNKPFYHRTACPHPLCLAHKRKKGNNLYKPIR